MKGWKEVPSPRLALLIAGCGPGEPEEARDVALMQQALAARGIPADDTLTLSGRLDRDLLLAFLDAARRRVASWGSNSGEVFLHYSGHGVLSGGTRRAMVKAGLLLSGSPVEVVDAPERAQVVWWEEVFERLRLPRGVALTMLPDC